MMNKQDLRGAFSKVQAPDGLFDTVCALEKEQKTRPSAWMIVRRAAAVAAVLAIVLTAMVWPAQEENYITAPGLLTVRAYAASEEINMPIEGIILQEGVEFTPVAHYDSSTSLVKHFPFRFFVDKGLYPDMEITIEVITDAGILYTDKKSSDALTISPDMPAVMQLYLAYSGQHFITEIDAKVCWQPYGFDYDHMAKEIEKGNFDMDSAYKPFNYEKTPAFIDVIIRADEYIVGYCVIEIREINGAIGVDAEKFSFTVLTIVSFPKVDGDWQHITEAYVAEQLKQIHESVQY